MSPSGEDEVFDTGASPILRSPELRRSTRTSSRKRSSTGSLPYSRPKSKKKMQTMRSPPSGNSGSTPGTSERASAAEPSANPFSSLGEGTPTPQGDILARMQEMMGGMLGGMEGRLNKANEELRTSVSGQLGQVVSTVNDLSGRVEANERRMDSIERLVEKRIEEGLTRHGQPTSEVDFPCLPGQAGPTMLSMTSGSYATALSSSSACQRFSPVDRKDRDYWTCRRSLRLRPIDGGQGDIKDAVATFLSESLKMDSVTIKSLGDYAVEIVPHGPKTKHKKEVIVRFQTVDARDIVKGSAPNLAGCGPDVGVRLEVPNFLKASMKALQSLSYDLKQKHHSARRNILFEDDSLDLVLDFCLGEGQKWRRVTAEQARGRAKKAPVAGFRVAEDELNDILASV